MNRAGSRWATGIGFAGLVALASGCASAVTLRAEGGSDAIDVKALGHGDSKLLGIEFTAVNHEDEPVGIDLDTIAVRDAKGAMHRALGERVSQWKSDRAAAAPTGKHEPIMLAPGAPTRFSLEFAGVAPGPGLTSILPRVFRLTIEGQAVLRGLKLALETQRRDLDAGFHDPFAD